MNTESSVPAPHKSLAAALLAAQRDISMLQRDQTNEHHGFDYASADGIISQCRVVLNKHGLVFRESSPKSQFIGNDNGVVRANVTLTMTLSHPESGENEEQEHGLIAESGKGRPIDKAILGVRTTLIGYAHRGLLNLPRFDNENQVCGHDDTAYDPAAIGAEMAHALYSDMSRLSLDIRYVRRRLVEGGVDEKALSGKLATWPKSTMKRIQEGIDKARAKQNGQTSAIKSLPQREDGLTVDTSTSQIEPERVGPATNGKPASNGTKNGKAKPAPTSDDFAEEMSRLM